LICDNKDKTGNFLSATKKIKLAFFIFSNAGVGIYSGQWEILYKLKNREEFEGGLNKSPQKQGRIFRGGGGEDFAGWPEYIPLQQ